MASTLMMKLKAVKKCNWSFYFFLALFGIVFSCVTLELNDIPNLGRIFISSSPCEGRLVYVYDLPSQFNDDLVSQSCNDSKAHKKLSELCRHFPNGGFGQAENWQTLPKNAWYQTYQYTLELMLRERFNTYHCRTMNPQQASLFYIPYYTYLDFGGHFLDKAHVRNHLSQQLIGFLLASPYLLRYHGADHLLVIGAEFQNFMCLGEWGTCILTFPELQNVTKVFTERNFWSYQESEIAIPYPTGFHPSSPIDTQYWQHIVSNHHRDTLISYSWGPRPNGQSLRNLLQEQCKRSSNCTILRCDKVDCANNPYLAIDLYLRSTFCLMPHGDTPTRKAIFDSILSGCIPVLFSEHSAYSQYIWHLPSNGSTYSVFYPSEQLLNANGSINIIDYLTHINADVIKTMQQNVIEIIPNIVYAKPGYKSSNPRTKDAFEVLLDKWLKRSLLYQK